MRQGRWVSYIFRYRDNVKCENAGFIKVQRISYRSGDVVRIQVGMKMYKKNACRCKAYLIYGNEHAKYLTDIYFKAEERDTIMKRVELPWDNPLGDGRAFEIYEGILFVCDDGEMLTGMWETNSTVPGNIIIDEPVNVRVYNEKVSEEDADSTDADTADLGSADADMGSTDSEPTDLEDSMPPEDSMPAHEHIKEESESDGQEAQIEQTAEGETAYSGEEQDGEDICVKMLRTYPRLPLFADSHFIECVKIVPQDIGKLAMGNWKLGVNSFLSHGYYRYQYLMLGKVKFDKRESYVIGVPGVFTNKEKYLANMFGFSIFIPVKKTKLLTGNFGYWISEVLSE